MLEYQSIKMFLQEGYVPNWSEEVFVIKKVKNTVLWTYLINDLNGEEIVGTFQDNEIQKTNQRECRIEKVSKKKGGKLYGKWKVYDNLCNRQIKKTQGFFQAFFTTVIW